MHRRTLTLASVILMAITAVFMAVAPTPDFAADLWRYIALAGGFFLFAVGLPAYLSMKANGRAVPWRRMGTFLVREAPIEAAAIMMIASALLIAGSNLSGGLTGIALLGFAVAVMAAIAAATVENMWGYMAYGDRYPVARELDK